MAQAHPTLTADGSEEHFSSYYEIEEPDGSQFVGFGMPETWLSSHQRFFEAAADLLRWGLKNREWPEPNERYNRKGHFGTWLRDHGDSCLNTRAKILIRDSRVPVTFNRTGCTVATGEWHDPYADGVHTQASEIQIDHMVPLKNAYISGAWRWDAKVRCAYANFMANTFHLIAVNGHENMSKSDSTPADWIPPNRAYRCTYLRNWLAVKLIWHLIMNPRETAAIQRAFRDAGCDSRTFNITASEIASYRQTARESLENCE